MASMTVEAPTVELKLSEHDDSLSSYRRLCEVRMRRLERYKKAKSFCNLDDEQNYVSSSSSCASTEGCSQQPTRMSMPAQVHAQTPEEISTTFEELKTKMVSLMENDVILFREMLTIADTLQELKMSREEAKNERSNSQSSLSDEDDEEDDLYICDGGRPFSNSMPGITRLFVDDEPSSNVQFFSRKNSVLRIPIPPRSSNRMNSTRKIPRRPSELSRPPRLLHIDDTESSASQSPQQSPLSDSSAEQKSRRSSGSIDSGIRDGDDSAYSLSSSDSLPSRNWTKRT